MLTHANLVAPSSISANAGIKPRSSFTLWRLHVVLFRKLHDACGPTTFGIQPVVLSHLLHASCSRCRSAYNMFVNLPKRIMRHCLLWINNADRQSVSKCQANLA